MIIYIVYRFWLLLLVCYMFFNFIIYLQYKIIYNKKYLYNKNYKTNYYNLNKLLFLFYNYNL